MTESPTLSRRVRTGRPKTEDVISTSSRWTDDRRRIIEGLSDEEIVMWHAMFGTPPFRVPPDRMERVRGMVRDRVEASGAAKGRAA